MAPHDTANRRGPVNRAFPDVDDHGWRVMRLRGGASRDRARRTPLLPRRGCPGHLQVNWIRHSVSSRNRVLWLMSVPSKMFGSVLMSLLETVPMGTSPSLVIS